MKPLKKGISGAGGKGSSERAESCNVMVITFCIANARNALANSLTQVRLRCPGSRQARSTRMSNSFESSAPAKDNLWAGVRRAESNEESSAAVNGVAYAPLPQVLVPVHAASPWMWIELGKRHNLLRQAIGSDEQLLQACRVGQPMALKRCQTMVERLVRKRAGEEPHGVLAREFAMLVGAMQRRTRFLRTMKRLGTRRVASHPLRLRRLVHRGSRRVRRVPAAPARP
jgi:hypothetical protein